MTADPTDDRQQEPLTPDERSALARLRRDRQPPAGLEARVMAAVGAAAASPDRARWRAPVLTALAASLIFALGTWLGSTVTAHRTTPPAGTKFMLLLYEDANFQRAADPSSRVDEYSAWARTLAQSGQLIAGDELDDAGVGLTATSATPTAAGDALGQPHGYFVIVAPDSQAASAIAATCPHLKYGGRIVVRKILT